MDILYLSKTTISDWRSGAHINHSVASIKKKNNNIYKDKMDFLLAYNAV